MADKTKQKLDDLGIDLVTLSLLADLFTEHHKKMIWRTAHVYMTVAAQFFFIVYSGVLMFTISAPAYMWFIWAAYQVIAIVKFLMVMTDLAEESVDIHIPKKENMTDHGGVNDTRKQDSISQSS